MLRNITGGSIGRCGLVPSQFREGNVSQHVAIIRQKIVIDEQTGVASAQAGSAKLLESVLFNALQDDSKALA